MAEPSDQTPPVDPKTSEPSAQPPLGEPETSATTSGSVEPDARAESRRSASPSPRAVAWHSAWITVIVGLFALLCATGVLLMTAYSPSTTTAWGSVWYIQTQMDMGWMIRGVHRFASDAVIVLLPLYLAYLLATRIYARRGSLWWIGLLLLNLGMAAALSGYVLPWDQRGYWGMQVRTNILALTPYIGGTLRDLLIGGADMGHLTLTRFYTLHVIAFPVTLAVLGAWWVRVQRRDRASTGAGGSQVGGRAKRHNGGALHPLRDALLFAVVAGLIGAIAYFAHARWQLVLLEAPADPSSVDYPARPEWFNLFLFQWLKGFSAPSTQVIGAVIVPGAILLLMLALPLLRYVVPRRAAHKIAVASCSLIAVGVLLLTGVALYADREPSDDDVAAMQAKRQQGVLLTPSEASTLRREEFHRKRRRALWSARRAIALANTHGVPPDGPRRLLANDPLTRGPELFSTHCASCHRYDGHNGLGGLSSEPAAASDLARFGTRAWVRGFLEDPTADKYFGRVKRLDGNPAHTKMATWLAEQRAARTTDQDRREFEENLDAVAAYLESESMTPGALAQDETAHEATGEGSDPPSIFADFPPAAPDGSTENGIANQPLTKGRQFFKNVCNECHRYRGEQSGMFSAPEMYGYGSVDWIAGMIEEPDHNARYRSRGKEPAQMPSFKDRLAERERRLIAEWLRSDGDSAQER